MEVQHVAEENGTHIMLLPMHSGQATRVKYFSQGIRPSAFEIFISCAGEKGEREV